MSRRVAVLLACGFAGVLALLSLPVLMFMAVLGGSEDTEGDCRPPSTEIDIELAADTTMAGLTADQLENAATVIAVGNRIQIPRHGLVVALAVANQESRFLNYANDGLGGDLQFDQIGIGASLDLPHQAVGTDHGSLGIFQQQWPWWGTMTELMDPATSARKFYDALLQVPGWEQMSVTGAGQTEQRSAYPLAYADDEPLAEQLLANPALVDADISPASYDTGVDCLATAADPGTVVFPLPTGSGYVDAVNWGSSGSAWSRGHTGTDFSVPCGTPVLAAHGGTVLVRTDQPWSGRWLVQVSTGEGRLTTWYAHMQSLTVAHGQVVAPGERLGAVGGDQPDDGNSTGCHLHFEVHPRGGSIYEDNVNPTAWLRTHVGQDLGVRPASSQRGEYIVATLNVLGHSHTRAGGNRSAWPDSGIRMRWAVQALERNAVDVVGLQELQMPQRRRMLALAGDRFAVFSPPGDPQDSIAWRRDRFELVAADTFEIPYFVRERRMPVVQLRDRATGEETFFVSVHNPASVRRHGNQAPRRAEAVRREVALVHRLASQHRAPVVLMGDFNEKDVAFCRVTASGLMHAANGGSSGGSCRPPVRPGIDWIFGSGGVEFSGYAALRDGLLDKTTDHPLVLARVG
jgi:murein DD-endopeptidase MepM/ murein hydrolase activator NlpD